MKPASLLLEIEEAKDGSKPPVVTNNGPLQPPPGLLQGPPPGVPPFGGPPGQFGAPPFGMPPPGFQGTWAPGAPPPAWAGGPPGNSLISNTGKKGFLCFLFY